MAAEPQDSPMEGVPGTPGIRELRPESNFENFKFCTEICRVPHGDTNPGIRRVSLRAEIDTTPPFGSVKEAVTRFGGSGPWVPLSKFYEAYHGIEEFDIKKFEEQAAELEKDLIVKELETLDVLEELGTTKRIVEELKRQLQDEALKYMTSRRTPNLNSDEHIAIKEMNNEKHYEQIRIGSNSSPCCCPPVSCPDSILMELKQAKLNLDKTINDLGVIQTSVEALNKKMNKEKTLLEKTKERLTCKFANHGDFDNSSNVLRPLFRGNSKPDQQFKKMVDPSRTDVAKAMPLPCKNAAEMRLAAAKKMEEAAIAAEALALIELNAIAGLKGFSSNEASSAFSLLNPIRSPRTPGAQRAEEEASSNRKFIHAMHEFAEANYISELAMLRKFEEVAEEIKHSKEALEEALKRVEIANRKQLDAEEALRRLIPEHQQNKQEIYNASKIDNLLSRSPLHDLNRMNKQNPTIDDDDDDDDDDEPKAVLKPKTVSMGDILSSKQVNVEECVVKRPNNNEGQSERQKKVALSQMLDELKQDLRFHPKPDHQKNHADLQKQYFNQRRKFGFIHISLPLSKQSKKKSQALNTL